MITKYDTFILETVNNIDYEFNINIIKKVAKENNILTEGDFIFLYHGTSKSNYTKILKSGKLNSETWLAKDYETSEKYAKMTGGKYVVDLCAVYMGVLSYNGYFSTMCDVFFKNGRYYPKDLK